MTVLISDKAKGNLIYRLYKYRIITPDGHWLWKGVKDSDGYGVIRYIGKHCRVHRMSAMLWLSDFTPNLLALHKPECHNPECWNPEHLYMGTQYNNMQDRFTNDTYKHGRNQYGKW